MSKLRHLIKMYSKAAGAHAMAGHAPAEDRPAIAEEYADAEHQLFVYMKESPDDPMEERFDSRLKLAKGYVEALEEILGEDNEVADEDKLDLLARCRGYASLLKESLE